MKDYALLIFDWDGTLMDSAAGIVGSMREAIVELKLPPRSDLEIARMIGLGLRDAFFRLYPELGEADLERLMGSYRRRYGGTPRIYGQPFPGVADHLDHLSERGYQMAVATGKSRAGLERALTALEWHQRFVTTRCADETAGKPDPLMVEEILWELDVVPEAALVVGDTSYDMEMARRAGVDAVGVAWGVHEHDDLHAAGAQTVLSGLPELGDWLHRFRAGVQGKG